MKRARPSQKNQGTDVFTTCKVTLHDAWYSVVPAFIYVLNSFGADHVAWAVQFSFQHGDSRVAFLISQHWTALNLPSVPLLG